MGSVVVWSDKSVGAAVWLLPAETRVYDAEVKAKLEFLAAALGATGAEVYRRTLILCGHARWPWWPSQLGIYRLLL
jgi:hypothetical protein